MKNFLTMSALTGYRTYLAAAGILLTALAAFLAGELTLIEAVNSALVGMGVAGLRASK